MPLEHPTAEDLTIKSRDAFENLIGELADQIPAPRFTAMAILELIRAECARIQATGKICP